MLVEDKRRGDELQLSRKGKREEYIYIYMYVQSYFGEKEGAMMMMTIGEGTIAGKSRPEERRDEGEGEKRLRTVLEENIPEIRRVLVKKVEKCSGFTWDIVQ